LRNNALTYPRNWPSSEAHPAAAAALVEYLVDEASSRKFIG
jgi:hypothetical protein